MREVLLMAAGIGAIGLEDMEIVSKEKEDWEEIEEVWLWCDLEGRLRGRERVRLRLCLEPIATVFFYGERSKDWTI